MHLHKKTMILSAIGTMLMPLVSLAADAPAAAPAKSASSDMTLMILAGLILTLLFVIGMLAGTLRQLTQAVREKIRREKNAGSNIVKTIALLAVLALSSFHTMAADAAAGAADAKAAAPEVLYLPGVSNSDFYMIVGVLALEMFVIFALTAYMYTLLRVIRNTPERRAELKALPQRNWFWDKFNSAASVENEKDVLLDHDYDGIHELDNALPPWWKYGFYLTIIIGIIYLYRFHISHDGLSSKQEYAAEMQKGEEEKAAYLAKSANNVDENTVTLLTDAAAIGAGKETFVKNCAPCHVADGGGNVGPNLTDDYWLHGGGIKDIFKSIKYGWQDKGMKSWKDDLSPKQIQEVASFIKSLHGTHPAVPKAPQGELYIEAQGGKTDSTAKPAGGKADSAAAKVATK